MTIELGTIPIPEANKVRYPQVFTAPFTSVPIPGGFVPGNNTVIINGNPLHPGIDYDDSDGLSIVLTEEFDCSIAEPANFLFEMVRNYRTPNAAAFANTSWANYAGTADVILLTTRSLEATRTTLQDGDTVRFRATATNTDDFTINWDGLGDKQCVTESLSVAPAGYIRTDAVTTAVWDADNEWFVVGREVERGSNANGDYVKFADGTQQCTSTQTGLSGGTDTDTATGDIFRSDEQPARTYPASFSSCSYSSMEVNSLNGIKWITSGATSFDRDSEWSPYFICDGSTDDAAVDILSYATGDWYEYVDPTA